jgi:hypothetical protein
MAHGHVGHGPRPLWAESASGLNPRWALAPGRAPMVRGARMPKTTVRLGRRDQPRRTAPVATAHSGTDSSKRAFGSDGTHRQRGWDGKNGEQERQRGEKAADVGCQDADMGAASNSTTASHRARLQTRGGGVGARGEASDRRRTGRRRDLPNGGDGDFGPELSERR